MVARTFASSSSFIYSNLPSGFDGVHGAEFELPIGATYPFGVICAKPMLLSLSTPPPCPFTKSGTSKPWDYIHTDQLQKLAALSDFSK